MTLKIKQNIAVSVLCVALTVITYYSGEYRKNKLESVRYNIGIVDDFWFGSKSGYNVTVVHEVNYRKIKSKVFRPKKCRNLKGGDTILVSYSNSDPRIVEIRQCYWKPEYFDSIGVILKQSVKNDWLE